MIIVPFASKNFYFLSQTKTKIFEKRRFYTRQKGKLLTKKDRLRRIASGLFEFLYFVGERVGNFKGLLGEQILNYVVLFKRVIECFKFEQGFFKEIFDLVRAVTTDDAVR